jgi:hypothetical protein
VLCAGPAYVVIPQAKKIKKINGKKKIKKKQRQYIVLVVLSWGGGAGFGVQGRVQNPTGGAITRWGGPLGHRAGERILVQLPSGG